jgi:tetratricopeptide (TPR) repeat protein
MLYLMTNAAERARAVLDAAIGRKPGAELYRLRALTAATPAAGAADLEQALQIDPKNAAVLMTLTSLKMGLKQYAEVLQYLDRLEPLIPPQPEISRMRAEALVRVGNLAEAKRAYETARKQTKSPGRLNDVCWSEATVTDSLLDDALKDCDAALAAEPAAPAILDSRGLVLLKLKRYAEAVSSYDTAIATRPRQAESLYGRGIAKLRLGKQAEGEADIAAALAISPAIEARFAEYGIRR